MSSEVDKRRLRDVVLEQRTERRLMVVGVPGLELLQSLLHRRSRHIFRRREIVEHRLGNGCETRQHVRARVAVGLPTEPGAQHRKRVRDRDLFALARGDRAGHRAHEVESPECESPLPLQGRDVMRRLAPVLSLGDLRPRRGGLESVEKGHGGERHRAVPKCGGREWESNPPRTGSRPLPDLKSGRPTGDASLPSLGTGTTVSPGMWNRSSRCLFMRRRSPRRRVTPWRSKNSRIWIATLRPLLTWSRNWAAVNSCLSPASDRPLAICTISATV